MSKMRVARLMAQGEPLELGYAEVPEPGPTDVLVKVHACGIVPNAYNLVMGRTHHPVRTGTVFGLDVAGTIQAVGEHVMGLKVGQRVYVDPHLTCGTCVSCRRGRVDLCPAGSLRGYFSNLPYGQPMLDRYPIGGMAEFVTAPDHSIAVLPDSVDFELAARFGYLGTSYAALERAGLGPGRTLLINGVTGTLGVAAVSCALAMGAIKILGIGRNRERLERVRSMAPRRVEAVSSEDGLDLAEWVRSHTKGFGADAMYDCQGVGAASESANALLRAVAPGGRVVLVGGSVAGDISRNYLEFYADISVRGSMWFTPAEIDRMIALIDADVIDLSYLETKSYDLADVNEALKFVGERPGGFVNVVVRPGAAVPS
jgi:alcohol dehydrogenase